MSTPRDEHWWAQQKAAAAAAAALPEQPQERSLLKLGQLMTSLQVLNPKGDKTPLISRKAAEVVDGAGTQLQKGKQGKAGGRGDGKTRRHPAHAHTEGCAVFRRRCRAPRTLEHADKYARDSGKKGERAFTSGGSVKQQGRTGGAPHIISLR